ncbi:MAG: glycosyltransferase family 4 protein, partial [Chthoniobacterales bacterium]
LKRELGGLPVRFEPAVYDVNALARIYDGGDVLVYPSVAEKGEAMPLAPLEGMARGLVPVVSDIAAFREYLEPGQNGVVFDHRGTDAAGNLADALTGLVQDESNRTKLSRAARATAERFSPAVIADKYLQLFEKVVSGT